MSNRSSLLLLACLSWCGAAFSLTAIASRPAIAEAGDRRGSASFIFAADDAVQTDHAATTVIHSASKAASKAASRIELVAQASPDGLSELSLRPGSRGPQVEDLQTRLQELGHYSGAADGIYGDATQAAVVQFQQKIGIPATGTVNQQTWQRLRGDPVADDAASAEDSAAAVSPEETAESASPAPDGTNPEIGTQRIASASDAANAVASAGSEAISDPLPEDETSSERSNPQPQLAWLRRLLLVGVITIAGIGLYRVGQWAGRRELRRGAFAQPRSLQLGASDASRDAHSHASRDASSFNSTSVSSSPASTDDAPGSNGAYAAIATNTSVEGDRSQSETNVSEINASDAAADGAHQEQPTSDQSRVSATRRHDPESATMPVEPTTRLAKVNIVNELIHDLHSPDPDKRRKAIWDLGQRGNSDAIQPLSDLMLDADSNQRSLILAAMSEIGVRSLKPLSRALILSLQDESSDVRRNAIRDVTRVYDLMAQVSQVLHHATHDDDEEVQETARWAMGQLDRIRGVTDSEKLLNGESSKHASERLPESTDS